MEQPKKMVSNIIESDSNIVISTPNKKSWILIVVFSIITLQFSNAIIQVLFFIQDMPMGGQLAILLVSAVILYFTLKGLLWQLKGVKELIINEHELILNKVSPLMSKTRIFNLADIKSVDIKDESVSEGPLAMLQLLNITDKIKVNLTYGYETVTTISGVDISEAKEIKNKIEKYTQSSYDI